jgi:hypothetical protein
VNIWGRSWWYRLYIIVGIPVVIALSMLAGLRVDPREPSMLPVIAPVLVWVAGLLIFQWIFLLRDGVDPVAPEDENPPRRRPNLRSTARSCERRSRSATARRVLVRGPRQPPRPSLCADLPSSRY